MNRFFLYFLKPGTDWVKMFRLWAIESVASRNRSRWSDLCASGQANTSASFPGTDLERTSHGSPLCSLKRALLRPLTSFSSHSSDCKTDFPQLPFMAWRLLNLAKMRLQGFATLPDVFFPTNSAEGGCSFSLLLSPLPFIFW